jgi:GNAT superfamily N-acetyltransferase
MDNEQLKQAARLYRQLLHGENDERPALVELDSEGRVAGALWVDRWDHPSLGELCEVSLVVHPRHQGCGIGTRMFASAKAKFGGTAKIAMRPITEDGFGFCKKLKLKKKGDYWFKLMLRGSRQIMRSSDIEDAYRVALVMSGAEGRAEEARFRKRWESAVAKAKEVVIDFAKAESVRRSNHGRSVRDEHMENPVILGKTMTGALVALDGSHRLMRHIENQSPAIRAVVIDISWIEDADDMDFDLP